MEERTTSGIVLFLAGGGSKTTFGHVNFDMSLSHLIEVLNITWVNEPKLGEKLGLEIQI